MSDSSIPHIAEHSLPNFRQGTILLAPSELTYNPCDDLIFPSVIKAPDCTPHPLGKYYMYYSPHNAPGGICLAYSSSLHGPWTEHAGNPVISNRWLPHHDVEHVSSPSVLFMPEEARLLLYYHGDNEVTRYAVSEDGVNFAYGGIAVDYTMLPGSDITAYARVYRLASARAPHPYVMLFMSLSYEPESWDTFAWYGLYRAWSNDARTWQVDGEPILSHHDLREPGEYFVCSPCLLPWQEKQYVVFHKDWKDGSAPGGVVSDLFAIEVDAGLRPLGRQQLFCRRQVFGNDSIRISDPCLYVEDRTLYVFASIGGRLGQSIGLTTATVP